MTSPSSFNVSGLLSSNSIDTTALVSQLMQAAAIPQTQLKSQLSNESSILTTYQTINTKLTALQTAAEALTDPTAWLATTATSSNSAIVATSSTSATAGTTVFSITQLASSQVNTIAADSSGNVVSDPTAGITITGSDGTAHQVSLTSGSAAAVAKSINAAGIGVRAAVINTDSGQVLQLSSTTTGASSSFTAGGFENPVNNITAAQDAKATVGDPANGGYSVSSSTNTFSNLIPGVTFSAGSLASNVSITVSSDPSAIAAKVQALVTAANAASSEMTNDSGQGAILQGQYDVRSIVLNVMSAVSKGTPSGASLKAYGIDMDKNGQMSFDPTAFQAAYTADPSGTKDAVAGGFATSLDTTTSNAVAPITGTITQAIASASTQSKNLSDEISKWTDRLADLQTSLTAKYSAMQTALAQLQSQQTYLTSMLKSLNGNSSSSSS